MDCPDASQLTPKRNESHTALQALAMLNDNVLIRQCDHLAERASRAADDLPGQINFVYRQLLARLPVSAESAAVQTYAQKHGLANACRILINSNEFLFVE